jgi:hypothetical protein
VSIGALDMRLDETHSAMLQQKLRSAEQLVQQYADKLSDEDMHSALMMIGQIAESALRSTVQQRASAHDVLHVLTDSAKSKGSFHNRLQVQLHHGVCLDKNRLISNSDSTTRRVLPCYQTDTPRSDLSSLGYVGKSLCQGLDAKDAYLAFVPGRLGLVDQAVGLCRQPHRRQCRVARGVAEPGADQQRGDVVCVLRRLVRPGPHRAAQLCLAGQKARRVSRLFVQDSPAHGCNDQPVGRPD